MINRYSVIKASGFNREMVLLKALPCKWGRCTFCDYIHDNTLDVDDILKTNSEVLKKITGEYGKLDVINSGSVFEIPESTLNEIRSIIKEKNIKELFCEAHWLYKDKFQDFRDSFDIPVRIRVGVESFDDDFRNRSLKKGMAIASVEELVSYCDSVCLMVGIQGQTREMIERDVEILTSNFKYGAISIFTENTTDVKADNELIDWFQKKYGNLDKFPFIDVLYNNLDYGVNA